MTHKDEIYARLDSMGIPFTRYDHTAAHTMEDCYALPFCTPEVIFCKNILLCNRQQTAFYLYVMPADKAFRTADISKRLNSSRLSFAPEECLMEMLGVQSGSLSPFAMWYDGEHRISLVFDGEVHRQEGKIAFHPCDNTSTMVFDAEVFWTQVIPGLKVPVTELEVPRTQKAE